MYSAAGRIVAHSTCLECCSTRFNCHCNKSGAYFYICSRFTFHARLKFPDIVRHVREWSKALCIYTKQSSFAFVIEITGWHVALKFSMSACNNNVSKFYIRYDAAKFTVAYLTWLAARWRWYFDDDASSCKYNWYWRPYNNHQKPAKSRVIVN